jgi:predicted RNA-binding Zn ribbon-like protein
MVTRLSLETVCDFVNTLDVEAGREDLDAAWFARRGLLDRRAPLDEPALGRARVVREALRDLGRANNGEDVDVDAPARVLDRQARRSRLSIRFQSEAVLEPAAGGLDGALGRLLATVAGAMADDSWRRFKACRAETCRWAFVDRARNHSRQWCAMEVCGNRAKARTYRRGRGGVR